MNLGFISQLLFPSLCLVCRKDLPKSECLCGDCSEKIERLNTLFCGKCRARLPDGKKICHKDFPYVLGAVTRYENEVARELVQALKFKSLKEAANPIASEMANYLIEVMGLKKDFLIVPVPLGRQRLRERGFNQSEIIANLISEELGLELGEKVLERVKETRPQSEQKHFDSRIKNVRDCFRVSEVGLIRKRNIVLVDDVTTSGATFLEAGKALKQAGAGRIVALAMTMA